MVQRRLPSILQRVTRAVLVMAVLGALLIAAVVRQVVHHEVDELMDQSLRESAEILYGVVATLHQQQPDQVLALPHTDYEEHLVWQIVDSASGQVLHRSHKAPTAALLTEHSPLLRDTASGDWRVVTFRLSRPSDRFLLVAQSDLERQEARAEAATYTLITALVLGVLLTLGLHALVRRELRPLSDWSRALESCDPLQVHTLSLASSRAELQPMERALQQLGQRLTQRLASERAFTAHAAHALRTPLAGIDVQLALALKEAPERLQGRLGRIRDAATRLQRVMGGLLGLFRSGAEPHWRQIALTELAPLSAFPGLAVDCSASVPMHVDPDLLTAALLNLLDNAQRHQATQVLLSFERVGNRQRLSVQDDGQGCPEPLWTRWADALERQDYSRDTGLQGLGLMLADLVMRAHGGRCVLLPVAAGFTVLLEWPLPPSEGERPLNTD